MWTLGGGAVLYSWLWMIAGREIVELGRGTLAIRRDVLGVGRVREYDVAHATNLRVAAEPWNPFGWSGGLRFWGIGGGVIAFDYGARTFRFAASVDEAEAKAIVTELKDGDTWRG